MNPTNQDPLPRLLEVLNKGTLGAIVLPARPTADAVSAATSLYFALSKMGKNISLVSAQKVEMDIAGADKIQSELVTSGDNLVISFPYSEGAIDKVDYNIQGEYFNLIIAPRAGYPKLDPKQVKYSSSGGMLDYVIVIDSPTLQSLGTIYTDNQNQFQGKDIINIDRHLTNAFYGTVNYVNKSASAVSEIMYHLIKELKVDVDKNIATNLYSGIASATNNFTSYSVNADTFEIIAQLLRMGALKKMIRKPAEMPAYPAAQPFQQSFQPPIPPKRTFQPQGRSNPEAQVFDPDGTQESDPTGNSANPSAPQEWLKPKIFRGGDVM